jgi:hypothetical protein
MFVAAKKVLPKSLWRQKSASKIIKNCFQHIDFNARERNFHISRGI